MGESTPNIDSRYSPIYQRGGTAGTGGAGAPAAHGSRWASPGEPPQQRPDAPAEPDLPPAPDAGANVVEVVPEGVPHNDAAVSAGRRFNPFLLALWLLGAALLALGLWAVFAPLQVDETAVNGPFPQWIFIISQSAGGIVVSGSILLAAAGALSAVRWDRQRGSAQQR
ncbi:hypothetical protein [Arthrobacter sp.]|uniref:hypothetical protein n=1 Tax=Arthrobacter sp. TaxID=1667 RepID=UPI002810E02F|nr:hypothetical protein [Arthrobacter sp.]